jgi:hypothetical protein
MSTEIVSKSPSGCTAHTKCEEEKSKNIPIFIPSYPNYGSPTTFQTLNTPRSYTPSRVPRAYSCIPTPTRIQDPHHHPRLPHHCYRACPYACAQPSPCTCRCVCGFSPLPFRSHIPMGESNEAVASVCPDGAHRHRSHHFRMTNGDVRE